MRNIKFKAKASEHEFSLKQSVELYALGICENIADDEKRIEDIERKCKILDSLSNALLAINT